MFKKKPTHYLDTYFAVLESDLAAEQETINETRITSGPSMDLSCQQAKLNMKRRAIESLKSR